jgi:hypothetical protein
MKNWSKVLDLEGSGSERIEKTILLYDRYMEWLALLAKNFASFGCGWDKKGS